MDDLTKLKSHILIYSLVIALICEVVSLPILGWDIKFLYGLVLGTAVSIAGFSILVFTSKLTIERGKKSYSFISYMLRLILYGVAFVAAVKVSFPAGIACLIGIFTTKIALLILLGIKPKFDKNRKVQPAAKTTPKPAKDENEDEPDSLLGKIKRELSYQEFEEEDKEMDTEASTEASKELRLNGRIYKTHKKVK